MRCSPRQNRTADPQTSPRKPPAEGRLTAAQAFLQGGMHQDRQRHILPAALPASVAVNQRSTSNLPRDTLRLTQADPHSGLFASPESRFDATTRGLGGGLVAQQDKLRAQVAKEVKTHVRREKEAAVIASRVADGERQLRVADGRIRAKATQREQYQTRMASYKFTK